MSRFLPSALLLAAAMGLSAAPARASHDLGGDLRYESLGNNRYRVTLRHFRDCSGIAAAASFTLNARVNGCAGAPDPLDRTATLVLEGQGIPGPQNCAVTSICGSPNPGNYEENNYVGTLTLPAAQWTLSVDQNVRGPLANIVGNTDMRFEATLDNRNGVANNSPNFGSLPINYVGWKLNSRVSIGAFDIDGDSLVFSSVAPLNSCGVAATYLPTPLANPLLVSSTPACVLMAAAGQPTAFSPAYPIATRLDTADSCPLLRATARPFAFNVATGGMTFNAGMYDPNGTRSTGDNRYAVAVQVQEYRRVGSGYRLIGTARREMMLTVVNCGPNVYPRFAATVQVAGQPAPQPATQAVAVRSGSSVSVTVSATDDNAGQVLALTANRQSVPGLSERASGPGALTVTFAPPATLPDGLYYVPVQADDNACPIKGFDTQTLVFRVYGSPLASRSRAQSAAAWAYPNPFGASVRFTLARPARPAAAVLVLDRLGRVVARLPVPPGPGPDASLTWTPDPALPAGLYLARFPDAPQAVRLLRQAP
ncbi:hypothetical protein LJ737_20495 [Hymenobacter sp. 15J16-1T3B]|uniref:hypothetical protein n=1 Tax=Hymenobacter sp. 15J16-1T3B TaxID=2886941 RepID=UPI001D10C46B|nr:hypothetical protein [Hymenobacter sp. 15J16-1T3B]MCC3159633.1 hypothetical protein [Hymenobacter sp. 15J16-1T3B]